MQSLFLGLHPDMTLFVPSSLSPFITLFLHFFHIFFSTPIFHFIFPLIPFPHSLSQFYTFSIAHFLPSINSSFSFPISCSPLVPPLSLLHPYYLTPFLLTLSLHLSFSFSTNYTSMSFSAIFLELHLPSTSSFANCFSSF